MTDTAAVSLALARRATYDPRHPDYLFEGFRSFAPCVIGDAMRKIRTYLYPKVAAAGADGISIDDISIHLRGGSHDATGNELVVRRGGVDAFVVRNLTTPSRGTGRSTLFTAVLRPGREPGISRASMLAPDAENTHWRYKVHDEPGVIPGLVEACKMILPFIADEVLGDTVTRDIGSDHDADFMALIEADGGLPGKSVEAFAMDVLSNGIGSACDWFAANIQAVMKHADERMAWPHGILRCSDGQRTSVLIRSENTMAIAHLWDSPMDYPSFATFDILKLHEDGSPARMENHAIRLGDGNVLAAIEALENGRDICGSLSMSFDTATRRVETTPDYLETRRYKDPCWSLVQLMYDWKKMSVEDVSIGKHHIEESDGFPSRSANLSTATPSP